jgi:hypothetical protein
VIASSDASSESAVVFLVNIVGEKNVAVQPDVVKTGYRERR